MRILIVTVGSAGDTHPFVGLAQRLKERGHEPTFLVTGHYAPMARAAGIEVEELGSGEEFNQMIRNPNFWHPRKGFSAVADVTLRYMPVMYEKIESYLKKHPEGVLVGSTLALGARVAQEKLGVPMATVHLSPSILRTVYEMPRLAAIPFGPGLPRWVKGAFYDVANWAIIEPVLARGLNEFRAKLGLPRARHVMNEWWNSPQRVIGMWPEWFGPVQPDWPGQLKLCGFPLWDERGVSGMTEELKRFLSEGDRPVAFTPGSAMVFGERFFEESVKACELAGVRGVLLSRHEEHLPKNLPSNVKHVHFAPFSELLPHCAAMVHHGGIGTTSQGLAAGVGQVIMPMAYDQFDNAHRARKLGVGTRVLPRSYVAKNVARAIGEVTSAKVRENATRVAGRFVGKDAIGEACEWIEKLR